ncbi:hypothetical protein KC352_g3960 [Hortaea werneckii]|nr:hypothetical protein KC350_g11996 [Hortaea werneckii]KAI6843119.1 hypothetical protein KC358_g3949 [Hortaea werneckii]KAI6940040.1 hypothetical protein KC341_g3784 [Hortaea werneckii]KAI6943763.1 hypothetical protein KC348_g4151 [Hortaea werneckii]KAI6976534.1 hypothetical protein KC321_g3953 [Hortaea werneckii]
MDSGESIVARIPTSIAGPRRLRTNSEVATMAYIKSRTTIPVPNILDWNDDDSNPVGTEYIFMDHATGEKLHNRWDEMTSLQHLQVIQSISRMIGQMTSLEFPASGSIYFQDAPLDAASKIQLEDGFCIGPHCGPVYWNCSPGEGRLYGNDGYEQGPWRDLQEFGTGLITSARSRIPVDAPEVKKPSYWGSIEEHRNLLNVNEKVLHRLDKSELLKDASKPTLLHADLHKRNIFVSSTEPSEVTAIIDWQATAVEPAFMYGNETPDLAVRYPGNNDLDDDVGDDSLSQAELNAKEKKERDLQLCKDVFEACMKGFAPVIGKARSLDGLLFRPFLHCNTSWRDSITSVRQDLIELSRRWNDLGLAGACPYTPTEDELQIHERMYTDFQTAQDLKLGLMQRLRTDSDGWVPSSDWDIIKSCHDEMFLEWLQVAKEAAREDGSLTEAKAREFWPFDQVSKSGYK